KQAEGSRIQRNNARRHEYQEALTAWKAECDLAKAEGRRACWKRPTLGKIEGKLPKPTFDDGVEGGVVGGSGEGEGEGEEAK
ncbi:hypothetical protein J3R83DRAFT_13631, partial [Lanmaoa asiatica]